MIEIKPLTQALLEQVEPEPIPYRVKGVAGVEDGKVLFMGCVMYVKGLKFLLFENTVELKMKEKRALIKGWRAMKHLVDDNTMVVRDPDKPTSPAFIKHFGGDLWRG